MIFFIICVISLSSTKPDNVSLVFFHVLLVLVFSSLLNIEFQFIGLSLVN